MEVKIFTDAATAFKTLVSALDMLAKSIREHGAAGIGFLERRRAKKIHDRLTLLLERTEYVVVGRRMRVLEKMRFAGRDPWEYEWRDFKRRIDETVKGLNEVKPELERSGFAIATQEFFPMFVESILRKQELLKQLDAVPEPKTKEEFEAVRNLFWQYRRATGSLRRANAALRTYLRKESEGDVL